MESKLIIIRGNSGSGKTTTANNLQKHFGRDTLLVSQDIVRINMLKVEDLPGNLSIDLIRQIAEYGKGKCEYVIVEGILTKERYGHMLEHLIHFYNGNVYAFYFDLSFEETVRRHNASDKRNNFGVDSLRSWWNPRDYLGIENETLLTDDISKDEVLQIILDQVHA